jgi:hypothetical protein
VTAPFAAGTVRVVAARAVAVSAAAVRGFSRVQAGSSAASVNAGTNVRAMTEALLGTAPPSRRASPVADIGGYRN